MRRHQHRLVAVALGVLAATVTALAGPQRLAGPDPSQDVASVAAPVVLQDVRQTLNRVNESVTNLSKSSSDAPSPAKGRADRYRCSCGISST